MTTTAFDDQFAPEPQGMPERAQPAAATVPAGERGMPDIAEFGELIDDYQCAQKDGSEDQRARARIALMAAYRAALAAPARGAAGAAPVGAPDRIFLVIGEDVPANTPFSTLAEVTWCADRVNDTDIEYVRAQSAVATVQADAQAIRNAALEEAAAAVEQHDRTGRSWVPDSLWGNITREAAGRIRALKGNSHGE